VRFTDPKRFFNSGAQSYSIVSSALASNAGDSAIPKSFAVRGKLGSRSGRLYQRFENSLQIEGRTTDDLEHVGGRRLLGKRFVEPALQLRSMLTRSIHLEVVARLPAASE
jgi:hypothetical protein